MVSGHRRVRALSSSSTSHYNYENSSSPLSTPGSSSSMQKRRHLKSTKPTDSPEPLIFPTEIWTMILSFVNPSTFAKLRLVSKKFRDIVSNEHNCREILEHRLGKDCPRTPPPLEGWQYLDLMLGNGCQSCWGKPATRRANWVFQRRWCDQCFRDNTVEVSVKDEGYLQSSYIAF